MITPSLELALNVTAISVSAPVPILIVLLYSVERGPPSPAVVPSWVCPVDTWKAAKIALNSLLLWAAVIVSPVVKLDCLAE